MKYTDGMKIWGRPIPHCPECGVKEWKIVPASDRQGDNRLWDEEMECFQELYRCENCAEKYRKARSCDSRVGYSRAYNGRFGYYKKYMVDGCIPSICAVKLAGRILRPEIVDKELI